MEATYIALFVLFAVPAAVLEYTENACFGLWERKAAAAQGQSGAYLRFRNNYVLIFSLMMAGDWLQGPYVYHLYEHYGYSVRDIGRLFIMGFGSSAVFGTMAGAMADRRGRKRAALLYVVTYSASCLTKHSPNYWVLLVGRLLGGIATSLLFSAFEAWAVATHNSSGFPESLLGDLFTKAVFLGNGVMAIASGLLGNFLVEDLRLGPVAPFDAAIAVLLLGGLAIHMTWEENYGDQQGGEVLGQFAEALNTIWQDPRVSLLGASQALFEASMYTFVFLWTPALSPRGEKLPHGFIFAIFMTASLVGTALAGRLLRSCRLESLMQVVFWCSAVSLFVPVPFHMHIAPAAAIDAMLMYEHDELAPFNGSSDRDLLNGSSSSNSNNISRVNDSRSHLYQTAAALPILPDIELPSMADSQVPSSADSVGLSVAGSVQLLAFCVFEVLIGMFWPSMMTLRAKYVPEEQRSTIINLFRVPLNLFVCIILWKVSDFPLGVIFALCSVFLAAAAACQHRLGSITSSTSVTRIRKEHVSDAFDHADTRQQHGDQQEPQQQQQQQQQQQHMLRMPEMSQRQSPDRQRQQQQQTQQPSVQFVSINRSGVLSRQKGSGSQLDRMH